MPTCGTSCHPPSGGSILISPWTAHGRIQQWIDDTTSYVPFLAIVTAMLAGIGIVLAAAGLHALTVYWVEVSRRELGIRRALGARHRDVLVWFASEMGPCRGACRRRWARSFSSRCCARPVPNRSRPACEPGHLAWGTTAVALYATAAAAAALLRALELTRGR